MERNGGALSPKPHQAAGRRRPCAVGFRNGAFARRRGFPPARLRDNRRMFVLFEEAGKYLGGRVLSEAESSAQVELDTGKRVKVKGANIVLRFEKPSPAD